jgi:hypothetical protein
MRPGRRADGTSGPGAALVLDRAGGLRREGLSDHAP